MMYSLAFAAIPDGGLTSDKYSGTEPAAAAVEKMKKVQACGLDPMEMMNLTTIAKKRPMIR